MLERDFFVGLVSVVLGIVLVFFSRSPTDQLFRFRNIKFLADKLGEVGARRILFLVGCGLLLVGGSLVWKALPQQFGRQSQHTNSPRSDSLPA